MRTKTVIQNNKVHFKRFYLVKTKWFSVFLHKFTHPDLDRDPHDHPWSFLSIILWGGYTEAVYTNMGAYTVAELKTRKWFSFKHWWTPHQVLEVKNPTWTLVFAGKNRGTWGFHTKDGWVPEPEYKL